MSDLQSRFENAAQDVQKLAKKPDNETLLQLYAFFKQATIGDVSGSRPGAFDLIGQAKYTAWSKVKGIAKEKAMEQYIALVEKLKP